MSMNNSKSKSSWNKAFKLKQFYFDLENFLFTILLTKYKFCSKFHLFWKMYTEILKTALTFKYFTNSLNFQISQTNVLSNSKISYRFLIVPNIFLSNCKICANLYMFQTNILWYIQPLISLCASLLNIL